MPPKLVPQYPKKAPSFERAARAITAATATINTNPTQKTTFSIPIFMDEFSGSFTLEDSGLGGACLSNVPRACARPMTTTIQPANA